MTMKDANKAKEQLVSELVELHQQVSVLAASDTELKRSEDRLAKVSECFFNFGTDAIENINCMTALCGELLGATCALYNRLHQGLLYSWGQWNTPPDYNPVDKPEGHICYDVIKTAGDKVLVVSNLSDTHYAETDPNVMPYKLQTYVGRAVKFGDDYVGSLCVVFQDDFKPSEMDKRLMEILASAIGVEEKRKQTEETLQQKITELDSFLNNIPDMAWLKDTKSRFIAVNQAFGEVVEMDPESLLNQTCEMCFGEEEGKKFQEDDRKVIESRKQQVIEEQIVDSRGKEIWLETIKSPILDRSGNVWGTVGIAREITRRKQAEEALKASEARYRALSNASFEAIFISEKGICIDTNQTATEMFGYDYDELIGIFGTDVIAPPYEAIAQRKDGTTFQVEIRGKMTEYKGRSVRVTVVHDIDKRKQAEEALQKSEEFSRTLLENMADRVFAKDTEGRYILMNKASSDFWGIPHGTALGKTDWETHHEDTAKVFTASDRVVLETGKPYFAEERARAKDGRKLVLSVIKAPLRDKAGNIIGLVGISRDITDIKKAEEALRKARDELERRVEERTADLVRLNEKLKQEIEERKQAEQELKQREAQLEIQKSELEEVNTALRVLLKRRGEDKTEFEEKVLYNVKELVVPYLERLKRDGLDAKRRAYVSILESNLNDIVSSFTHKLSSKYLSLTPTEIQIANLVRQGRTTKEIAEILNSSDRTVEFHRKNIRKKIGIVNRKVNLRSHLLTM
jgi:PAS domain S-box-containing protein